MLLSQMDELSEQIMLFATTNLYSKFDKAFIRRFDATIDFGRYTSEDRSDIAVSILNGYSKQFSFIGKNTRLFKKILANPGEMKNIIRSSIAFSKPDDENDYLRRLYTALVPNGSETIQDIHALHDQNFTLREIEILTGISRSTVAREIKEASNE